MSQKTLYRSYRRNFEIYFLPYTFVFGVSYNKSDKDFMIALGCFFLSFKF